MLRYLRRMIIVSVDSILMLVSLCWSIMGVPDGGQKHEDEDLLVGRGTRGY